MGGNSWSAYSDSFARPSGPGETTVANERAACQKRVAAVRRARALVINAGTGGARLHSLADSHRE